MSLALVTSSRQCAVRIAIIRPVGRSAHRLASPSTLHRRVKSSAATTLPTGGSGSAPNGLWGARIARASEQSAAPAAGGNARAARTVTNGGATSSGGSSGSGGSGAAVQGGSGLLPCSITRHPRVAAYLPYIGNVAYMALTSGFVMTDILGLRVMLVLGYSGLVCFHLLHPRPLRIPLIWSAVFVTVNAVAAFQLANDRFPPPLEPEYEALHRDYFPQMSRGQFSKLIMMAEQQMLPRGQLLTEERIPCNSLYFIVEGEVELRHHGAPIAKIGRGGFVNDVAYQSGPGSEAYGTIRVKSEKANVLCWSTDQLRQRLEHEPGVGQQLNHVLVASLVRRLLQQRDQREPPKRLRRLRSTASEGLISDGVEGVLQRLRYMESGKSPPKLRSIDSRKAS